MFTSSLTPFTVIAPVQSDVPLKTNNNLHLLGSSIAGIIVFPTD
jgi:hypothetical protein